MSQNEFEAWKRIERRRQLSRVGWLWDAQGYAPDWEWKEEPLRLRYDGYLLCSKCGDETIEGGDPPRDVHTFDDLDEYEPGNPTDNRGGYTLTTVTCTCGQRMALVTGNHKGAFYIKLYSVEPVNA